MQVRVSGCQVHLQKKGVWIAQAKRSPRLLSYSLCCLPYFLSVLSCSRNKFRLIPEILCSQKQKGENSLSMRARGLASWTAELGSVLKVTCWPGTRLCEHNTIPTVLLPRMDATSARLDEWHFCRLGGSVVRGYQAPPISLYGKLLSYNQARTDWPKSPPEPVIPGRQGLISPNGQFRPPSEHAKLNATPPPTEKKSRERLPNKSLKYPPCATHRPLLLRVHPSCSDGEHSVLSGHCVGPCWGITYTGAHAQWRKSTWSNLRSLRVSLIIACPWSILLESLESCLLRSACGLLHPNP